jgi:hypothetical protein
MRRRLTLLCIVLSACRPAPDAELMHVDELPRLVAVEDGRIGDFDDPNVGFSRVAGVAVDRDGNIHVLEALVPEIRVYSPDGELLRRIGRRGGGPGEFEGVPRFGVVGDTVWTVDSRSNRITLFDRSGVVLSTGRVESVAIPLPGAFGYLVPWTMLPDGRFTSHFGRVAGSRDDAPTGVRPTDSIPVPFVRFAATGAVVDTIGWAGRPPPRMWRPPWEDDTILEFVQVGSRRLLAPRPPTTMPWWLPLPDGYVLVEIPPATSPDGEFTVTRIGLAGDTVYSRPFRYRAVRYSAAELDTVAARVARGEGDGVVAMVAAGGGRPAVPPDWEVTARALRGAMRFPEFRVPIDYPWASHDESLWIRLAGDAGPTARWVLLDAAGRPRGQLELPAHTRIMWSHGDVFWAVEPDEYDVPWVVRYSIRPA